MELAGIAEDKALGTDTYDHILVGHTLGIQHFLAADEELFTGNLACKDIDRGRTQELGDKEIVGVFINLLGLADLLNNTGFHNND